MIAQLPEKEVMIAGGAVLALAFLYWLTRKGNAFAVGSAIGGAAVDTASGVVSGVVVGGGELFGLPTTNKDKCKADCIAGNYFEASVSCPAPDYLRFITTGELPL